MTDQDTTARLDWERRIYQRTDTEGAAPVPHVVLPAVVGLSADGGAGHVMLHWEPVNGAVGYVIDRQGPDDAAPQRMRHGGSDVSAVVENYYADTALQVGPEYQYRVRAVAGADGPDGAGDEWVAARAVLGGSSPPRVGVRVQVDQVVAPLDRVWHMIGSERLSQVFEGPDDFGNPIGSEFVESLRIAVRELGATRVRAHAILHDDLKVVRRGADGQLELDFDLVDRVYDTVLATGLRPVVELSFMPEALASDPSATVFGYRGIISPPTDWTEWTWVISRLVAHLVERYGLDEVVTWAFEVWNEPDLEVFWSADRQTYLVLYEATARAVKSVHPDIPVGGPATAAGDWLEAFAAYVAAHQVPLDFLSTHTYGNVPIDPRPILDRHGLSDVAIWWTEWGVGSTHFGPIHDGAFGAPFVVDGMKSAQGRLQALAYWVISDHFEELGRPPRLLHNGFGLLTVGNLRKPRFWALKLVQEMGPEVLATAESGDGAGGLVGSWASRHPDGTVDVLLWNTTRDAAEHQGNPLLDREIQVTVSGLPAPAYTGELTRIDSTHSNIGIHVDPETTWPDEDGWRRLHTLDRLYSESVPDQPPVGGQLQILVTVPMPGVVRLRLTPQTTGAAAGPSL
ncbi:MAG: GH39 family glycosyl hydrolase [Actinomycetes bacterium]